MGNAIDEFKGWSVDRFAFFLRALEHLLKRLRSEWPYYNFVFNTRL